MRVEMHGFNQVRYVATVRMDGTRVTAVTWTAVASKARKLTVAVASAVHAYITRDMRSAPFGVTVEVR